MENPQSLLKETALVNVTLTDSFDDNSFEIDLTLPSGADLASNLNALVLMWEYQLGDSETSNTLEIQVECGVDTDDLYIGTLGATSSGVITLSDQVLKFTGANATAPYRRYFPLTITARYLKISVREAGVASNYGTVSMKCLLAKS